MGCSGIEQWSPPCVIPPCSPPSSLFCHPPAIMPTCMRAPSRLNRFVKGPQWMREVQASKPGPRVQVYPLFEGLGMGVKSPPVAPSSYSGYPSAPPPRRDNRAYVKTTCSFDSHLLISDPIEPKSAIVHPSKCLKSACAGERACTLYPANHSWHSCHSCHGLGSEVVKTESMSWLAENGEAQKEGLSAQRPHWSSNAGGKCRQVRTL